MLTTTTLVISSGEHIIVISIQLLHEE